MKRPYGKINIVALLMLAGVVIGIWLLITIGPAYLDNLDVKEGVSETLNQLLQNYTDEQLKARLVAKLATVGDHLADDGYGTITRQRGLGITADDIEIERDDVHGTATITVSYTRVMELKPLNKEREINFVVSRTGPLHRQ